MLRHSIRVVQKDVILQNLQFKQILRILMQNTVASYTSSGAHDLYLGLGLLNNWV